MGFPERAVESCRRDWSLGTVVETHVRDVLKCKAADVSSLEEFIGESHSQEVRVAAARVIAAKGNADVVISAALKEGNRDVLFEILSILGTTRTGLDALNGLISSEDTMLRDEAVDMFRRTGNTDVLFLLVFDRDDNVVKRIKRYIDEAGKYGKTCCSRRPS